MSYENLVTQTVVASVRATDDFRKRFIPFVRRLVERPQDYRFKLGGRKCKIAAGASRFDADDHGGCAGQIVIEAESDSPQKSRLGFKLTRGLSNDQARLTLTFNPSRLLAAVDVAPTMGERRQPAPENPASSQFVNSKLLGFGFDLLDELHWAEYDGPLFDYGKPRFEDDNIRLDRVAWDALFRTKEPQEFLLFLVLVFDQVYGENSDCRPFKLGELLKLKMAYRVEPKTGDLSSVTFTRLQGDRRKLYSIEFSLPESGAADENDDEEASPATASANGDLRLRVTAHPTGIDQLIREGLRAEQDQDGDESDDADTADGAARNVRDVGAMSEAIAALAAQAADRGQNSGSFAQWLVTKMLRDTLYLDVVGGFDQTDVETFATSPNPLAKVWAKAIEPMNIDELAQATGIDYERVRRFRKKQRDEHKIDIGVPRAFYSGVTAAGATARSALDALAGALSKADVTAAGGLVVDAAKRFADGRRKVIGAAVEDALAGRLGEFPVEEVSGEIKAPAPLKRRAARKVAVGSKTWRATMRPKPGAATRKPAQVKPTRASRRKSWPTAPKGRKRGGATKGKRRTKR
jgi:hypothetical protein